MAVASGFSILYLYTPSAESFYAKLGWNMLERTRYRETDVTIMTYTAESSVAKPQSKI